MEVTVNSHQATVASYSYNDIYNENQLGFFRCQGQTPFYYISTLNANKNFVFLMYDG